MTTLKQASKIEQRLRRHAKLMEIFISDGFKKEEASKMAFIVINQRDRFLKALNLD